MISLLTSRRGRPDNTDERLKVILIETEGHSEPIDESRSIQKCGSE